MDSMWLLLALVFTITRGCLWLYALPARDREGQMLDEEPTMNTRGKD